MKLHFPLILLFPGLGAFHHTCIIFTCGGAVNKQLFYVLTGNFNKEAKTSNDFGKRGQGHIFKYLFDIKYIYLELSNKELR